MKDYCTRCKATQTIITRREPTSTAFVCAVCGLILDRDFEDVEFPDADEDDTDLDID